MNKIRWKIIKRENISFFFKYEPSSPELLHIYVRHLTTVGQALWTWFNGKTIFNEINNRFETVSETHCLYWNYLKEDKNKILIITCFNRGKKDE